MSDSKPRETAPRRAPVRRRLVIGVALGVAVAIATLASGLPTSASAAHRPAIPAAAITRLTTTALALASRNGDEKPTSMVAVMTTRANALHAATPGDSVPGASQTVYLVVMRGRFTINAPTPPGAPKPTGTYLSVIYNRSTFQTTDLGLSNHAPPVALRTFGRVSVLLRR